MPRAFSELERQRIRAALLTHGRALLSAHGIRKVSVDDLVKAAGIAKGSFYAFFASKEELFFTVFEEFEADYQQSLLNSITATGAPVERISRFMAYAVSAWRDNPLFRRFGGEEYRQLLSGLPPERVAEHLNSDEAFARHVLERFATTGAPLRCSDAEFTYLMRVLFLLNLHADDFGPEAYQQTMNLMIDMIASRLVGAVQDQGQ